VRGDGLIETAGLSTAKVEALSDALKALRRRRDRAAEFLIVNSTGGDWRPIHAPERRKGTRA
jgi:hypothetical protein